MIEFKSKLILISVFFYLICNIGSALKVNNKLATSNECRDDVKRICGEQDLPNDLAVLDCLQNNRQDEDAELSTECHNLLWSFKLNLTKSDQFLDAAEKLCSVELQSLTECQETSAQGHKLSCLLENIGSIGAGQCKSFLVKIGSIVFSDYRLIERFTEACKNDVQRLQCGRAEVDKDKKQGTVIACLSQQVKELSTECYKETLRVAELQADDYHLDRPLFFACRDDRETFCRNVQPGDGRVYKCLMKNKMRDNMSTACREQLTRRQQLISEDVKVSKGMMRACRDDMKQYSCMKEIPAAKDRKVKLAHILLCLENAMHKGEPVSNDCQAEMLDHRRALLDDYRLSPEIVRDCHEDIKQYCRSKEIGGKTLHCLMKHSRRSNVISDTCRRSVEELLQATDVGSQWEVDSVLKEACQSVVDSACGNRIGHGQTMSCLMDKLYSEQMTSACQAALLEIQYFVARDFRLDAQLYAECKEDAVNLCRAPRDWAVDEQSMVPNRSPQILPCLYRLAYHAQPNQALNPRCLDEVKRVMRQRAGSVDLLPEVEEACIQDLGVHCSNRTGKGEEMLCLQDKLEKLTENCRTVVVNFTEEEAEHLELNPVITTYCARFLETHCIDEQDDGDEGDVMDCLVDLKMSDAKMNSKCRAAVEHFQLIALKDFRFSPAFKRACKLDISRYCSHIRDKTQVVGCLSEVVRNDSLAATEPGSSSHRISRNCRQQLRQQVLQQHEDIRVNPVVNEACKQEQADFCGDIKPGRGRVVECLKSRRKDLGPGCRKALFQTEREEMEDNTVDFPLISICSKALEEFCKGQDSSQALECLKRHMDDLSFFPECKVVVSKRMIEQNLDVRFNPVLKKACWLDINKFCRQELSQASDTVELEGQVLSCLKRNFVLKKSMTDSCQDQLRFVMEQQALDYRQDHVLTNICQADIDRFCGNLDLETDGQGRVEECLKKNLDNPAMTRKCKQQVALLVSAVKADIHTDPILLRACAVDLKKHCDDVPRGDGRKLNCLLQVLDSDSSKLDGACAKLLNDRKEMFRSAAQAISLESINDLVNQVSLSPSRNYFLVIALSLVGCTFFFGIVCGRVTKRHIAMKNK